ncbi:hypothetical protein IscW_ISCW001185 [Ixodes scapularis]|uniref:Uncharacterized protein n=1 Tax=Ixodes scapularis TaxID=6945 RepID=B7P3E4_IXOSC|nr:hypothetical protein IscW_ISCW001185 [Ixodes scapularis]|eukprot:XP_002404003.1 hypothetical protein IscW_ISCW001185 [Ixodes scapularis]
MAALSGCRPAYETHCAGIFGVAVARIACSLWYSIPTVAVRAAGAALAAVLESLDVVGWSGAPGDTVRPAVGFFSRWASPEAPRRPHRSTGLRAARHTASTSDGASLQVRG